MFAKVKKGTICKALGDTKKTVVSRAKQASQQVAKEVNKTASRSNNTRNTDNTNNPPLVLSAAPPLQRNAEISAVDKESPRVPVATKPPDEPKINTTSTGMSSPSTTTTTTTTVTETNKANGVLGVEWNKLLLQYVSDRRQNLAKPCVAIEWSDTCYEQALIVAHSNAQNKENKYGSKVEIKAAIKQVHTKCRGTFKVTTQTKDLTLQGSTDEALQNFYDSQGHWSMLIDPENVLGAFAAVQKANRVYWVGIFVKLWPGKQQQRQQL